MSAERHPTKTSPSPAEAICAEKSERPKFEQVDRLTVLTVAPVLLTIAVAVTLPWTWRLLGSGSPMYALLVGLLIPMNISSVRRVSGILQARRESSGDIERIGPYRLIRKLGAGGMGEVYLAEHKLMQRRCAVKLIHPEKARNADMRSSFSEEARATASLTHWNTVEIYDYGTAPDGRFFYVMEHLEGLNLAHFLNRFGPMPAGRVTFLLLQLCDALYEAESLGLVHRDIKPSNIFLTRRGGSFDVAKVLDFGLVQSVPDASIKQDDQHCAVKGSPSYMSPEQATGRPPDVRADIYSLGCVAYSLLAGRPPFVNDNPIMLIVAHATADIPPFEEIGADVPADLAAAVMKCLKRNPADRHQSFRDFYQALEACRCSGTWDRAKAENWWKIHGTNYDTANHQVDAETLSAEVNPDTTIEDSTILMDNPGRNIIDHEEPTLIGLDES